MSDQNKSKAYYHKQNTNEENIAGLGAFWEAFLHERLELTKFLFASNALASKRRLKINFSYRLPKTEMTLEITAKGLVGIVDHEN